MSSRNSKSEFSTLKDIHYLDHIGAGIYADSQIDNVAEYLKSNLLGNPHALNLSSKYCKDAVDQMRLRVLEYFGTNGDDYSVIFTSGTTSALKNVVEWFDWNGTDYDHEGQFVYLKDNHTSVLGLREIAVEKKANIFCLEHDEAFKRFNNCYTRNSTSNHKCEGNALFVYPAMCNFNGCKYPLNWVRKLQDGILDDFIKDQTNEKKKFQWFCLLDAAAYVPTNKLDLGTCKADFVAFSFYKIFGYPTGLGAILMKNTVKKYLKKTYYGGGTVLLALSDERLFLQRRTLHEWCEDGTLNYLSILSLKNGFDTMKLLGGEIESISTKVFHLTRYLHDKLLTLHHSNGQPAVKVYRDTDYSDATTQGGVINFNLLRHTGEYVGYLEVLHITNLYGIHVRTGCFCNPGACQRHLNLTNKIMMENYERGHTCANNIELINGYPTGSVRASFGYMSSEEDADSLLKMIMECFVQRPPIFKIPDEWATHSEKLRSKFESSIDENSIIQDHPQVRYISDVKSSSLNLQRLSHLKNTARLSKIFIYPIKSCRSYNVCESWPLTKTGLRYDREWMVISVDRVVMTQKQIPKMCAIIPNIDTARGSMQLRFHEDEGLKSIVDVPLNATTLNMKMTIYQNKVCDYDKVEVTDCGESVATWLSIKLNKTGLRLVKLLSREGKKCSPERPLALSKQAQYLLITETSVKWLLSQSSTLADIKLSDMIQRFRSNFVIISNFEPLDEFNWGEIKIGAVSFEVEGPCQRCQMICIDQVSGEQYKEPLTVLSSSLNGKIKFGIYLNLKNTKCNISTSLRINDVVTPIYK